MAPWWLMAISIACTMAQEMSFSILRGTIARTHGGVRNDSETHETVLLDCTTGNPVTSVECVSLSFRTPPCVLAFITYILWTDGIAMALVYWIWHKLHIFQIRNLFHCVVESWWNMPFKGTWHGDGVVHGAVAMLLRLWKHAATLWHHAAWIRIVTSHNAWMGYAYS